MSKRSGAYKRMGKEFSLLPARNVNRNYLKYLRHVTKDARQNYGLTPLTLHALFFMYDLEFFTEEYLRENYSMMSRIKNYALVLSPIIKLGHVGIYFNKNSASNETRQMLKLDGGVGYKARYAITQQGRLLIQRFYRKLEGDEAIYLDDDA
jgi:hypothetical protein